MLKPILLTFVLMSAAVQGCGGWDTCTEAEKNSCAARDHWCTVLDCSKPTANTLGTDPGIVVKLGTCRDSGSNLAIVAPFFTPRTRSIFGQLIEDQTPNQCQPFDVVWNVCNSGAATSPQTTYFVRLKDQVPPGVVGLDIPSQLTAPALAPCACDTRAFVSPTGFHCNEPAFTPTRTDITTTLGASPPSGSFTVGL